MKHIIVIGAGASGLMAAVTAARRGAAVTLLEGMEKPGKKLLVTGNGKCNLTNLSQERQDRYRGAPAAFVNSVLSQFPVEETLAFFAGLGLLLCEKNGYIYPSVGQASAVLEVLLMECRRLGVKIKHREKAIAIERQKDGWLVRTEGWQYEGDAVILATGSKAAPQTGSDGSGYALAAALGHTIVTPAEALTPLKAAEPFVKKLAGLRMPVRLRLRVLGGAGTCGTDTGNPSANSATAAVIYTEEGELQWTDYGISGIVVFQLSRYAVRALQAGQRVQAELDLLPQLPDIELLKNIQERPANGTAAQFLTGMLPSKMIPVLLKRCGIAAEQQAGTLTSKQHAAIASQIKCFSLEICGQKGFEMAQVCAGGVDTSQVHAQTLESALRPGIYFAGELLDVDAICGGYNLQWAWSSGYTAGVHACD